MIFYNINFLSYENSSKIMQFITHSLDKIYSRTSRFQKRWLLFSIDFLVLIVCLFLAFFTRLEFFIAFESFFIYWKIGLLFILSQSLSLYLAGVYRSILFYSLNTTILKIFQALSYSLVFLFLSIIIYKNFFDLSFPRLIIFLDYFIVLFFIIGVRFFIYSLIVFIKQKTQNSKKKNQTIIWGAGEIGSKISQFIKTTEVVAAFIDDNPALNKQTIGGIKIYNPAKLKSLLQNNNITKILIAIPSISQERLKGCFELLKDYPISIKTVLNNNNLINDIKFEFRDIHIEDLVGRTEVKPITELLEKSLTGKTIVITGVGGSIGNAICEIAIKYSPKMIVLIDNNEKSLYETINLFKDKNLKNYQAYLCDILSEKRLSEIFKTHPIDIVYHAAAYKHVNIVEKNPIEAIITNVFGTMKVLQQFIKCKTAKKFVLISTDKAVNPTSVMGQTKKVAEYVLKSFAMVESTKTFTIVRFGNVIYSSGSVIPRFEKLIKTKQNLLVTHKNATRYFMSLDEAASLVIQASSLSKTNDIFHLDMGNPVKIYDLAYNLIRLHGLVPNKDIYIKIGNLLPGEKVEEENLIQNSNHERTKHPKIYRVRERSIPRAILDDQLTKLFFFANSNSPEKTKTILTEIVFKS